MVYTLLLNRCLNTFPLSIIAIKITDGQINLCICLTFIVCIHYTCANWFDC